MKWLDEKGRLFGKLHFFDLLIIVLLLVGGIFMALRLTKTEEIPEITRSAEYVVELRNAQEYQVDGFEVGDVIYENGNIMGKVVEKKVQPSVATFLKDDGTTAQTNHTLLSDVFLTIQTDQLVVEGGYHIGEQELLNGTSHNFSNGYIKYTVIVREVRVNG